MSRWLESGPKEPSLPESFSTVPVSQKGSFWKRVLAFSGPGMLIAVGYMDPGNWATDLAGGARFGYQLLSVVLISSVMAMLLQYLALKLGIVTGRDLAQACRDAYSKPTAIALWILCEVAITACDLAEVIGSAIALNLLFKIPLPVGIVLTALDVMLILVLQQKGFRALEAVVMGLIFLIAACFAYEIVVSKPDWFHLGLGFLPSTTIVHDPEMFYIAVGILGATVMPHNLYLHSSIVQTRAFERNPVGRAQAVRYASFDSAWSLICAFLINSAILVVSAAAFYGTKYSRIADLGDAYSLFTPLLGAPLATVLFGVALLASGQNSTLTGTLAGQIVMEGFLDLRMKPWKRRLLTRSLAIIPAVFVALFFGRRGVGQLLIWSQVVLSVQLSFAVVPLVLFTNDADKMGVFKNGRLLQWFSWAIAGLILLLNAYLAYLLLFASHS